MNNAASRLSLKRIGAVRVMNSPRAENRLERHLSNSVPRDGKNRTCEEIVFALGLYFSKQRGKNCISGINGARLLVASHIKPWSKCTDGSDRTKMENGRCLSVLYDKSFDKGFFTIDNPVKVKHSSSLKDHLTQTAYEQNFVPLDNQEITLPSRGKPTTEFLNYHNEYVFVA